MKTGRGPPISAPVGSALFSFINDMLEMLILDFKIAPIQLVECQFIVYPMFHVSFLSFHSCEREAVQWTWFSCRIFAIHVLNFCQSFPTYMSILVHFFLLFSWFCLEESEILTFRFFWLWTVKFIFSSQQFDPNMLIGHILFSSEETLRRILQETM